MFFNFRFIAEESDTANNVVTDDPTWIIDPIDGTNNYVQRIPFVAISVAFAWKKEICFGITYNPILNEFYEARLGNGAFLNGKPIRCSSIAQLKDATIGHEVSFIRVEKYRERNLKQVTAFATASHGYVQRWRQWFVQKLTNSLFPCIILVFDHLGRVVSHWR